jgi:glutathione S-transferase
MEVSVKVYGHPMSTCTRKVLTTLAEKGHRADLVLVDLMKGEHKQPEHLARQPFGVIPVFEDDDGFQMYESRAIIRYLDAKLSGPSLTPSDLKARARMEQWINVEQSNFSPPVMKVVMEAMFTPMRGGTPNQEVIQKGREGSAATLDVIEKALAGGEYLAGAFSLAEIAWMPYLEYLAAAGGADLINDRPNVAAWWKRISERPSWQLVTGKNKAET